MPAEFFLEVTMEAYERARIFPSLMVMPGYKQNPLYPPEKPICLHIKKEKKNPISRGMEPMWILISLFIILKYRKEWENYLKDFYITWTLETSESMHFKETKSMVTQQKIFTPLCLFASTERFLVSKQGNVKKIGCYYCNSSIFFWASALCLLFLLLSLLLGNSKK